MKFKLSRDKLILIVATLAFVSVGVIVFYGCKCRWEKFENKESADAHATNATQNKGAATTSASSERVELSKSEQELFDSLKENTMNEDQVQELVKRGVLNERLVEKFLAKLEMFGEETDIEDKRPSGA
jgi:hypothetical protein